MHDIKIFAELYWAVERPRVTFRLNDQLISADLTIVDHQPNCEKVFYSLSWVRPLPGTNVLEIEMSGKTDHMITPDSDHWISIKDIEIDGVRADSSLHDHTVFRHKMSAEWIAHMATQGHTIVPEYTPGTDIRLNGTCHYKFHNPLWQQRILHIWHL